MSDDAGRRQRPESATASDLKRTLATAGTEYLAAALSNPDLNEEHVALITRNRAATESLLQRIGSDPRWVRSYEVKAGLVRNPHSPRAVALSLVKHLFWRDLSAVADDYLLAPSLRKLAEKHLSDRIPEMAVGERIALARISGRGLFPRLLEDHETKVLEALLWNGRLTEQDLSAAAGNPDAPPETLAEIGRHPRWRERYAVRLALARNRRTPLAVSLGFLTSLTERDLGALAGLPETPRILRLACERVLKDAGWVNRRREDEK